MSYGNVISQEAQWTVPSALTKNFLDGEVELEIIWTSEVTNSDVEWEVKICPISVGANMDKAATSSYRSITSNGPTTANNLCRSILKFVPTVHEMNPSDFLIIKVRRNTQSASDNLAGNADLIFLSLIENI